MTFVVAAFAVAVAIQAIAIASLIVRVNKLEHRCRRLKGTVLLMLEDSVRRPR